MRSILLPSISQATPGFSIFPSAIVCWTSAMERFNRLAPHFVTSGSEPPPPEELITDEIKPPPLLLQKSIKTPYAFKTPWTGETYFAYAPFLKVDHGLKLKPANE